MTHAFNWTVFTTDDYIINKVEEMASSDNQPITTNCYAIFEWYQEVTILDEDENEISNEM